MFNANEILIIGDSFATKRDKESDWPRVVVRELTGQDVEPRGQGFSGCSWWSVRNEFLEEVRKIKPKLCIFTHTEPQRIPSDINLPLNSGTILNEHDSTRMPIEVYNAGKEYYLHLYSEEFHYWAQQQWYAELDSLISSLEIPYVVHFHVFRDRKEKPLRVFKTGITFDKPLWDNSDDYKVINESPWKKIQNIVVPSSDTWMKLDTRNHLTAENNLKLGMLIVDNIKNYSVGLKTLTL